MKTSHLKPQDVFRVAWRNCFRNRRRFYINLIALALFQILYLIMIALGDGSYMSTINSATSMFSGHYALQHMDYQTDPSVRNRVVISDQQIASLRAEPQVSGLWPIVLASALLQSSHNSLGAQIMGVDPFNTDHKHGIRIIEGQKMNDYDSEAVWVSEKLLKKLRLRLNHKVLLSVASSDGNLTQKIFHIRGVFNTGRLEIDNNIVLMSLRSAQQLLGYKADEITRLAVNLIKPTTPVSQLPFLKVIQPPDAKWLSWKAVFPQLDSYVQSDRFFNFLFMNLLMFTILFMISNTLFMSGRERKIEFSTLLSIGSTRGELRFLLLIEVMILATMAAVLAGSLGQLILWPLSVYGLDFSQANLGQDIDIAGFSVGLFIYPTLEFSTTLNILGGIWLSVILIGYLISFNTTRVSLTLRGR